MRTAVLLLVVLLAVCCAVQGVMICQLGKYLLNDECKPCPGTCSKCDSDFFCTKCNHGYYGESCSRECNANCRNNICDKSEGVCISCADGFFKEVGNKNCVLCPTNCLICISATLCRMCKAGFKGQQCQEVCTNCKPGTECDQTTGECRECKQGLTGAACSKECDSKCSSCQRLQGDMCIACSNEKFGIACEKDCSIHCLNGTCYDTDGSCVYGCQDGYWGNLCDNRCLTGCNSSVCDRVNGVCIKNCPNSLNSTQCNCPVGCSCDNKGICLHCDSKSEFMCGKDCKGGCRKQICFRNISCQMGCEDGYTGNFCNKKTKENPKQLLLVILLPILGIIILVGVAAALIRHHVRGNRRRETIEMVNTASSSASPGRPTHKSATEVPLLKETQTQANLDDIMCEENEKNEEREEVANAAKPNICDDNEVFEKGFQKLRTEEANEDRTVVSAPNTDPYKLSGQDYGSEVHTPRTSVGRLYYVSDGRFH